MSTATIDPTFALAILQAAKKGVDATVARDETSPGDGAASGTPEE